jgi:hypothetical protein
MHGNTEHRRYERLVQKAVAQALTDPMFRIQLAGLRGQERKERAAVIIHARLKADPKVRPLLNSIGKQMAEAEIDRCLEEVVEEPVATGTVRRELDPGTGEAICAKVGEGTAAKGRRAKRGRPAGPEKGTTASLARGQKPSTSPAATAADVRHPRADDAPTSLRCFHSPQSIADQFGVPPEAVLEAVERGELPGYRMFGEIRIAEPDLLAWLKRRRVR